MPDLFKAPSATKSKKVNLPQLTTSADLPRGNVGFFTNFRLYPEGITLENQESDEVLLLFLRRDFFTNTLWIVSSFLLLFVPFFFTFIPFDLTSLFPATYLFVINLFYYLAIIGFILVNFTTWFYNISIVTTQRVLDLDYANITYKHVGATTVDNVEDISYIQAGFFRSFFDYGKVRVQTKGEVPNFDFDEVPRPATVVDIILDLIRGIRND